MTTKPLNKLKKKKKKFFRVNKTKKYAKQGRTCLNVKFCMWKL